MGVAERGEQLARLRLDGRELVRAEVVAPFAMCEPRILRVLVDRSLRLARDVRDQFVVGVELEPVVEAPDPASEVAEQVLVADLEVVLACVRARYLHVLPPIARCLGETVRSPLPR